MRISVVISILFLLVGCNNKKGVNEAGTIKINNQIQKQSIEEAQNKDSIVIEEIIFGRFCGECGGNCAPMFRLNIMGNVATLWADYENDYFKGTEYLKFKTDLNKNNKLSIACDILKHFPQILKTMKPGEKTFGCPDCTDGCGIYVEITESGWLPINKKFRIDLYASDNVPTEITDYAKYINLKIKLLLK